MVTAVPLAAPFPYFGGKQRIAPLLVESFPAHEHYVEAFAGSLSVLLAKPRSRMETVNDLDGDIMTFWRVLREQPGELARVCALTPHSRAEHQASRERDGLDDLERARRIWVALTQGRAGQLQRTGWRYYISRSTSSIGMPGYLDAYVERMAAAAERLHHVSLECRPALEVIAAYGARPECLLYVDPPYLADVRGGPGSTNAYRHEMKTPAEHAELLEHLLDARSAVVLSGYAHPLYDDALAGWDRIEIPAFTGQGNHTPGTSGRRTEVVWSNRPIMHSPTLDLESGGER